ncbi:MAG: hypothetical protein OIF57_06660 [Marinobacterium sp.]|nr:hypothetical protein [Marinobacterium sp.]
MKTEHRELKEKIDALGAFIFSNSIFETLPKDEQVRMTQQLGFMNSYLGVLDMRLFAAHK